MNILTGQAKGILLLADCRIMVLRITTIVVVYSCTSMHGTSGVQPISQYHALRLCGV